MRRLAWSDDVAATVAELRSLAPPVDEVRRAVAAIIADVREHGDDAVRRHTARLDGVELPPACAVRPALLDERLSELAPGMRAALETAAANVRAYHEREAVAPWRETLAQGQVVGQEIVPLAVAGLYVPGGLADYPSSVLMTAIPAVWLYNYFQTKIDFLTVEMTYTSKEMIDYLIKGVGHEFGRSAFTKDFPAKVTSGSGHIDK